MKKPEKKKVEDFPQHEFRTICEGKTYREIAVNNYNQACNNWEKYHKQQMKQAKEFINELAKLTGVNECDDWNCSILYDKIEEYIKIIKRTQ